MISVASYHYSLRKRIFDLSLALLLLVILLPLILIICLSIGLLTGMPVFFTQQRLGYKKKPFTIFKFRTMYPGADKDQHQHLALNAAPTPMFKIYNDPRFTKIGKLLSRTGLDELPQLLNILKGEMSFVGPRPLPAHESAQLPRTWNFRYKVTPGIFSDWTVDVARHQSLHHWKLLDAKTVSEGGVIRDSVLITRTVWGQIFKSTLAQVLVKIRKLLLKY